MDFANSYIQLYLNSGFNRENDTGLITIFLLSMIRILPILALAPYLGGKLLPRPAKVGLGIALFLIFFPQLMQVTDQKLGYSPYVVILVLKEMLIGTIMGLLATIPSFIVQGAGMFIDHQRGGASLQIQDPTLQNQASPIGTLYDLIYVFMFWAIDGPFMLIDAISLSFDVIPPDKLFAARFFNQQDPFWTEMVLLFNYVMKIIVKLASPSLIVILMTDTFLGIANRLAPQVMITFLGMPLKSFLGIFIILLGWKQVTAQMLKEGYTWALKVKEYVLMFGVGGPA